MDAQLLAADDPTLRFEPLTLDTLDELMAVEERAYAQPWSRRNFSDALRNGYHCQLLRAGDALLGYFVAMVGVDEVHLLNITVAPEYQRQGWSRLLLDTLVFWSRQQGAQWVWLEVRLSNARAIHVYETHGYRRVSVRKDYYPAANGQREHALVMNLALAGDGDAAAPWA